MAPRARSISIRRRAHSGAQPDDRGPQFDRLRAIAWLLPSLRTTAKDTDQALYEKLDACQAALVELAHGKEPMTVQRGLEASLAQGLKLDAVRQSKGDPDPLALDLLREDPGKVFWFSRLLALQAVTIRALGGAGRTVVADVVATARSNPREHPFVRECARLCDLALRRGDPRQYIWDDSATVAAGQWGDLHPDATRLIGDLVILLNLNERSSEKVREEFGKVNELPHCLSESPDRFELRGLADPPKMCALWDEKQGRCLCPYSVEYEENRVRRELSRAFCRHERLAAGRRIPWQRPLKKAPLQEFWDNMEDLGRF